MFTTKSWCDFIRNNARNLTREEYLLCQAEFFFIICEEIKEIFREQYRDYFSLMKFTIEMENNMLDVEFLRFIILDILSTEEYNLNGIATYTNTHEDVVHEVVSGLNVNPSANFLRKIIALHRSVRRELYEVIMKKIISEQ